MTTQQHYDEVKNFIAGLPGMIGPHSDELACLTATHRASKATCDLEMFRAILKSMGYEPQHRGSAEVGYHWQLSLPEKQLDPSFGVATRYAMTGTTRE